MDVGAVVKEVKKGQGIAVLVSLHRLVHVDFTGSFFSRAEVHEYLVLYTPAGIGGELCSLGVVKGGHSLYQADSPDRNELILVGRGGSVLLHDVRHQPEIVLDEPVFSGLIPLRHPDEAVLLVLFG